MAVRMRSGTQSVSGTPATNTFAFTPISLRILPRSVAPFSESTVVISSMACRWEPLAWWSAVTPASKVVVNPFYVAIEVPGFTRRDLTP